MLDWKTLSHTDTHEILTATAPEGEWNISTTTASSGEFRIKLTHAHPEGLDMGEIFLLRKANPERAQELNKYMHQQDIGLAGSMTEAKLVCELLHERSVSKSYDALYETLGYVIRHQFENERGDFFISEHRQEKSIQLTETPEMLSVTYETSRGAEFIVILSDPDRSEMPLAYPDGIHDYRAYALTAAAKIMEKRKTESGKVRIPLK